MKKILILTILFITMISCSENQNDKVDYANELTGCLSINDIRIINEACKLFEEKLKKEYREGNLTLKYKNYLKDINTLNVSENFINKNTPNQFIDKFKLSDTFKKIWLKNSESYDKEETQEIAIEVVGEDNNQIENYEEIDYYRVNPNGEYLNCLLKTNQNKYISEYLKNLKEFWDVSPHILAGGLCNTMTEKEFGNKILRLIIAINFYYELKMLIDE